MQNLFLSDRNPKYDKLTQYKVSRHLSISIITLSGASLSLKAFVNVLISFSWSFISWFVFVKCVSKLSFATRVSEILCSRAALVEFHETCILLAFCVIVFFTCPRSQTDFERAPGKYHKNRSIFNPIWCNDKYKTKKHIANLMPTLRFFDVLVCVLRPCPWYWFIGVTFFHTADKFGVEGAVSHLKKFVVD